MPTAGSGFHKQRFYLVLVFSIKYVDFDGCCQTLKPAAIHQLIFQHDWFGTVTNSFLTVFIFVYVSEISTTSPSDLSSCAVLILSHILNGLADSKTMPAIALLMVFLDEKPITVPTITLIAPAVALLIDEN